MRAFITGITGFAGTHLAEHLLAQGDRVLGCSYPGHWLPNTPVSLTTSVDLMAWDVSECVPLAVRRSLEEFEPDCVFHLAAVSVPRACGHGAPSSRAWAINVQGTRNVLDLAAALPRRVRVLLTSSSYVYAPIGADSPVVSENAPLGPTGAYGKTKLAAEGELLRAAAHGLEGISVRAFQHAGPRQDPRLMLSEWCRQIVDDSTETVRVLNLDSYFDMSDVRDVVSAYRTLILQGRPGTYNVGSGICRRSGDVLQQLLAIAKCDKPIVEVQPGIRRQPIADISRLQRETGWKPEIPIEQTLADACDYWHQRT